MPRRYSREVIEELETRDYSELSKYQRKVVRERGTVRSAADIARSTGAPLTRVERFIHNSKIDPSTLRYLKGIGFVGVTPAGVEKIAGVTSKQGRQQLNGFYTRRTFERDARRIAARKKEVSPGLKKFYEEGGMILTQQIDLIGSEE